MHVNWSRWQPTNWKANNRRPHGPDLADMGTAFALDASFDDAPPGSLDRPAAGAVVEPAASAPPSTRQRWWPRWRAAR
jgi:hypothetical protein